MPSMPEQWPVSLHSEFVMIPWDSKGLISILPGSARGHSAGPNRATAPSAYRLQTRVSAFLTHIVSTPCVHHCTEEWPLLRV